MVLPAMVVAVVALLALVGVPSGSSFTGAFTTIDVRQHEPVSARLCPDPKKPVPVMRSQATTGTGKLVLVNCISAGSSVPAARESFGPEIRRKKQYQSPFAQSYRVLT